MWFWFEYIMWLSPALVSSRSGTQKIHRFCIEPKHYGSTIQVFPFNMPFKINNSVGLEEITNIQVLSLYKPIWYTCKQMLWSSTSIVDVKFKG